MKGFPDFFNSKRNPSKLFLFLEHKMVAKDVAVVND